MMSDFHMDFFRGFATNSSMFEKSYLINVFLRIVNQLLLSVVLMFKTYVQPVLMYGLEIVQPKQTNLKKLEVFQKNILKQILMLQIQQYTSYQAYYLSKLY
jgi:hypothetical protein